MATAQRTLPAGIEIFRPGRHIDDAGGVHEFSPADVAAMAAGYNPALREAPLTVGHPQNNLPAYGWVARLQVNADGHLAMETRNVEPQFAELVSARRFTKRSASFYAPAHPNNPTPGQWYLRHVAFLGAQPPAIAGLKDIPDFAEDDGAISFSEEGDDPHAHKPGSLPPEGAPADLGRPGVSRSGPATTHYQEQDMDKELEAANKKAADAEAKAKAEADARASAEAEAKAAKAQLAQFAEQQRTERHAGFVSFAEAQVKAGKLLPKDQAAAVAVLDQLADSQPVEFAEGDAKRTVSGVDFLKGLIEGAKPVVQFGEFAPGAAGGQGGKGLSDAEIDAKAKAYAQQHKVSYAEALGAVVSFTA